MERALNPDLLRLALGQHDSLPAADEISDLIAQAELALLLGSPRIDTRLIGPAWYLHAIASSKYALHAYGLTRQRAAFRVAGHIFDLAIKTPEISQVERLKYCFGSQIAYLRSELSPNALAVYSQEIAANLPDVSLLSDFAVVSLCCGVAFLGFDVGYIYRVTRSIRNEVGQFVKSWDVPNIFSTPYGAAAGVASATRDLMTFLAYGRREALERARQTLQTAIFSEPSADDQVSRWIAAHLLNLSAELDNSSIWSVLPPDSSLNIKRAFAMGRPRVLTLWPPQIELLKSTGPDDPSPLSADVRRLFLSTPTSSGKTLLAQLLIASHLSTRQTSVYYIAPTRSLCREVRVAQLRKGCRLFCGSLSRSRPRVDRILGDIG